MKDKPSSIGELLFIPFIVLCWALWAPCALIKDLALLLYIPFDVQRLYDTVAACRKNLRKAFNFFKDFKSEEKEESKDEKNTIGFNTMPSVFPGHPNIASGLGCVDDEECDEEEEEY